MKIKDKVDLLIDSGEFTTVKFDKNVIMGPGPEMIVDNVVAHIRKQKAIIEFGSGMRKRLTKEERSDYIQDIAEKVGWTWKTDDGKFPDRVYNYFQEEFSFDIDTSWKAWISEKARLFTPFAVTLKVGFTREFDWEPGDYGDSNSCFWMSRSIAKDMILENEGFAVLFHGARDARVGRCWGAFYEDGIVVFNAYNNNGSYSRFMYSIAVGMALDLPYCVFDTALYNKGKTDGFLFINEGLGDFLLPTKDKDIGRDFYIDLNWDDIRQFMCSHCSRYFRISDETMVLDSRERAFCVTCAEEYLEVCPITMELLPTSEMVMGADQKYYSQEGWTQLFSRCAITGQLHYKTDLHHFADIDLYIHKSYLEDEEYVKKCSSCEELRYRTSLYESEICHQCYREREKKRITDRRINVETETHKRHKLEFEGFTRTLEELAENLAMPEYGSRIRHNMPPFEEIESTSYYEAEPVSEENIPDED